MRAMVKDDVNSDGDSSDSSDSDSGNHDGQW